MQSTTNPDLLTVGLAQIAPVWLNRDATLAKIVDYIGRAAEQRCRFVVFGEALLPGYPFWIELTDGARFNSQVQKEIHAHYVEQAVQIEAGDLDAVCAAAARHGVAVMLGCIERPRDRGGYSIYCSRVYIGADGAIGSVHRKLMPTYEERLTWAQGDGHGLRVHRLGAFTVGGLNCYENWMPLSRAALYAQGEDLHVALWPGNLRNTEDITRFIAKEGRGYTISVSALMRREDFPADTPHLDLILAQCPEVLANGGSCIAAPDGTWLIAPAVGDECLLVATLDRAAVRRERQNLDQAGHYARPDVTRLVVDRRRQGVATFEE
ncbi:carbon-nitrogen hydrolase family protein [Janthinobacterium fluminis]|uniref:Carbon-nitrogen hydrolase family protein n=1 Tax=Janthinobacterium fluminis TaxID=2987524 RepID=A0ABT5K3E9_9BURK|nr:carbon-nitrogen hydrolase family protein [Janthinobacterium fluminis]MDC8759276.1 carbon-nitrogen hydrolase family protein [Janthinobacterium fluminis]